VCQFTVSAYQRENASGVVRRITRVPRAQEEEYIFPRHNGYGVTLSRLRYTERLRGCRSLSSSVPHADRLARFQGEAQVLAAVQLNDAKRPQPP
jgi:hypothetical protein